MNTYEFDIAIIGGGCIGSSVFHELLQRGHRSVVLIDQGRRTVSATARSGGMLRVFHESPKHVQLALESRKILASYQEQRIIRERNNPNGSLYFFKEERLSGFEPSLRLMKEQGYSFDVLTSKEGQERFPDFSWSADEWAVYEPMGGHLTPSLFVEDLIDSGIAHGGSLLENFEVTRICAHRDRYRVFGRDATVTARTLVLSGGARLLARLRDLAIVLPLEAKPVTAYWADKTDSDFVAPNYFDRETLGFGGFGQMDRVVLSDPNLHKLKRQFWGEAEKVASDDCYSPGRLGALGRVPGHDRLHLATGWGGTAFKFALEIGRQVASEMEPSVSNDRVQYACI